MPHAGVSARPAPREDTPDRYRSRQATGQAPAAGSTAGRRTVTIRGYGADRPRPLPSTRPQRRAPQRRHERPGFNPDRMAMWAVMLGVLLLVVAAMSAHA